MTEKVNVTVSLHPQHYRALTAVANGKTTNPNQPVQVHHLIEHLVTQALEGSKPLGDGRTIVRVVYAFDRAELTRLHAEGLNDREIGELMGFNQATIRKHRHALELDKNVANGRPRAVNA